MIQWSLKALRAIGADPVVVVVGQQAELVKAACGSGVAFAVQSAPRGTGHAALAAEPAVGGFTDDLLVLSADLPSIRADTLLQLVATHRRTNAVLTLLTAQVEDPTGWGRIVRHRGEIETIVEESDATDRQRLVREVNVGVYCANAEVLFPLLRRITPDNRQEEIYLTDVVSQAKQAGLRVASVTVGAEEVRQINRRRDLAAMEKTLRTEINIRWMDAGVTLEDPDTTYIGPDVSIGPDTVIGPNVQLRGRTHVGQGCRFDGSAFLTDATLGDHVHVRFGVVMTDTRLGAGCLVGPFAHLRPGTQLAEEVHIGDFVETKNAKIGRATKANHLAYLGDAEIGSESNIGAGTITCNYDGFAKHRTVIGSRVQVGSDSQLVAPVTVGDDAYVASGTTVRRDVAAGALAYNSRQEEQRPGWVAAWRVRHGVEARAEPERIRAKTSKTPIKKPQQRRPRVDS